MSHPLCCNLNHLNTANHIYQCTHRSLFVGLGTKSPSRKAKIHEYLTPSPKYSFIIFSQFPSFSENIVMIAVFFNSLYIMLYCSKARLSC